MALLTKGWDDEASTHPPDAEPKHPGVLMVEIKRTTDSPEQQHARALRNDAVKKCRIGGLG
jgi:hypothetical protein